MSKIGITSIFLKRGEGPNELFDIDELTGKLVGPTETVTTMEEADKVLRSWSYAVSEGAGTDKCDFIISYKDGETYEGCYLLHHPDFEGDYPPSLTKHILLIQRRYIVEYDRNSNWLGSHGKIAAEQAQYFLVNYEID